MRDFQKQRLYDAENDTLMWEQKFSDHMNKEETVAFVDKIACSQWWRNRGGRHKVEIYIGRAHCRGHALPEYISLPTWACFPMYILHELTHLLLYDQTGTEMHHTRPFCKMYLQMLKHWLGTNAEVDMRACFRKHKVKYRVSKVK
jgi:predicted SprT family Zn-dependent metalloprotease